MYSNRFFVRELDVVICSLSHQIRDFGIAEDHG